MFHYLLEELVLMHGFNLALKDLAVLLLML